MGVYAGPSNAWSNSTNQNKLDASTKVVVQSGLVLNLDAGVSSSYSGSGTIWTDLSGSGNNGTLVNGVGYNSSNGGSLSFDGVDDYVNFGNIFNDIFAGAGKKFTISSWVKYSNLSQTVASTILSKNGDNNRSENQRQFNFFVRNPSNTYGSFELEFFTFFNLFGNAYAGYRTVSANIQTNRYYNFVVSYDGSINSSSRYSLYVNSQSYSITTTLTSGSLGDIPTGNARLSIGSVIGQNINNSPLNMLNGNISQVSIYNRALTAAEISQNFNALRGRFGI